MIVWSFESVNDFTIRGVTNFPPFAIAAMATVSAVRCKSTESSSVAGGRTGVVRRAGGRPSFRDLTAR